MSLFRCRDKDKKAVLPIAKGLLKLGFNIYATEGTADSLKENKIEVKILNKIAEGSPNVLDLMKEGKMQMVINTPTGRIPRQDEVKIRSQVIFYNIPYTTTISGAQATLKGIGLLIKKKLLLNRYRNITRQAKKQKLR